MWPHVRTDSPEQNPDLALLDDQQSNADSVTHALECFTLSNQRHWNQPVTKTLDIYRQAKPGSLALRWLLHSEAICGLNRREHAKLLKLIVHCLVAEGNLDTVTEWILAKDAPTQSSLRIRNPDFWRGKVLSYTVQAQAYWTQEILLLEESVQTYLSTTQRAATDQVYIPHSLSAGWLFDILAMKTSPSVNGTSFDKFRGNMAFWMTTDPHQLEFAQARLSMEHPLHPDPLPALHFLQKHRNPHWASYLSSHLNPAGKNADFMGWKFLVTTAQLFAKEGKLDTAKWVLDLGKEILPLMFQMKSFKLGSTTNQRQLPTPDEAAAGL